MSSEEAKAYINYCIKNAGYDPGDFEGMNEEELIKWAEDASAKAEAYFEALRKQED